MRLWSCQSRKFLVRLENEEVAHCGGNSGWIWVIFGFLEETQGRAIPWSPQQFLQVLGKMRAICSLMGDTDEQLSCDAWIVLVCAVVLVWSVGTWTRRYGLSASSSSFVPHHQFGRCRDLTTWGSSHWSCTCFCVVSSSVTPVCQHFLVSVKGRCSWFHNMCLDGNYLENWKPGLIIPEWMSQHHPTAFQTHLVDYFVEWCPWGVGPQFGVQLAPVLFECTVILSTEHIPGVIFQVREEIQFHFSWIHSRVSQGLCFDRGLRRTTPFWSSAGSACENCQRLSWGEFTDFFYRRRQGSGQVTEPDHGCVHRKSTPSVGLKRQDLHFPSLRCEAGVRSLWISW